MKILMIGTSLNTKGGISASVKCYISSLKFQENCQIKYIATHIDRSMFAKLWYCIIGYMRFCLELIFFQPHIVHIHAASRASFYRKAPLLLISIVCGKIVIYHHHGGEFMKFYNEECGIIKKKIIRWLLSKPQIIIALSEHWKRKFDTIIPGLPVRVLPNAIKIPDNRKLLRKEPIPHFLFMGRIGKQKGIHDLISAASLLAERGLKFKIILCGDGDISAFRDDCEKRKISHLVAFKGWVNKAEKEILYKQSDVYVLPSYNEGLPMSVLEAISYGLPIVATPVGGVPDAVKNGINGYLVEPGDVNGLADKMSRLILKTKIREEFGYASRAISKEKFDISIVSKQLYQIYKEVLAT